MDILLLLIPLSVVLVLVIGAFFGWAVNDGQFDDLEAPARRILVDDDGPRERSSSLTGIKPGAGDAP